VSAMMNKFSPEQAKSIIDEARARVADRDVTPREAENVRISEGSTPACGSSLSVETLTETRNQRDARKLTERDAQWEIERMREQLKQQRIERERAEIVASAANAQRIADLEAEVLELAKACNAAIDALEIELSRVTGENLDLKARFAELQCRIADANAGKPIDLPNILPSRRMQ